MTKNDTYRGRMTVDEIEDAAWKSIRFGAGDHIRDMPRMLSFVDGFVAGDAHGYQRAVSGASPDFMTYKEFFCKEDFETLFPNQDAAIDLWVEARLSCAKEVDRLKECLAESRQGYEQRIAELETLVEMVLAHDESQQWLDDAQKLARELKTGNK